MIQMVCVECGVVSLERDQADGGWRLYLRSDEPPELAAYCPECAKKEFGAG
jgi:hypothetical protein